MDTVAELVERSFEGARENQDVSLFFFDDYFRFRTQPPAKSKAKPAPKTKPKPKSGPFRAKHWRMGTLA
jgi:hypothetical protein